MVQNSFPSLSIIFPNLNGEKEYLFALLASIKNSRYPRDKLEVIVVDNGSSDNSIEFIRNLKSQISNLKLIENKKNLGFAKAINQGIKKSHGEYIFITNNDVVLEKTCFSNLVQFLINNPKVGVVGGKTYFKNSSKVLHPASRYNFYTGLFRDSKKPDRTQKADWIPGSGMCFPKSLWEKLGGFDEGFFFIGEDLDFCLRAKNAGFNVIYNPKAILWHGNGATVNRPGFESFKYYQGYRSKLRLLLKHGNSLQIVTSFFLQFIVYAPYRSLVLREKSFLPLLKATIWNIKNLSETIASRRMMYEHSS